MGQDRLGPAAIAVGTSDTGRAQRVWRVLEDAGHDVALVGGPAALRSRVETRRPDLIVLSFDGMESDGYGLCRELCSRWEDDPLPVLVVTAGEGEGALHDALAAGADDVLPGPPDPALLRLRVEQLLRSRRLARELARSRTSLENVQRIAGLGSWTLDLRTREMWWSSQTFRALGFEPGEGKTDLESFSLCMHPEDRAEVVELLAGALEETRPFYAAHRVVLPTGAVRHVELRGEGGGDARLAQGTIQDITEQRRVQERIRFLANYDSLTGLSNRRRFVEQLERVVAGARERGGQAALLYMDLDQFKRINDTLGHSAGDRLLEHVSQVLFDSAKNSEAALGREAEISRVGGDEFAVVLSDVASREAVEEVARRIQADVTQPTRFEQHQLSTTASMGIAIFPDHGEDAEALVKHADTAMYRAKDRGRNTFAFFSRTMNAGTLRRLQLETHLRHALEREELRLLYQPRLDLPSLRVSAVEALLRWDQPELGAVLPDEFIPVAEETGLIVSIGEWVLTSACLQAQRWTEALGDPVAISVNVSSRQFVQNDLRCTADRALAESGLDPRQLELEITESVVLENDEKTSGMLRELKAMGVRIALDDFGTGYSSLSYLTRFPLDRLKLDRSLVSNLAGDEMVRGVATAVIAMAHAIDLSVTAEGVDDLTQARFLHAQGCDELQGFLLAGPVPPEECPRFFASRALEPGAWTATAIPLVGRDSGE